MEGGSRCCYCYSGDQSNWNFGNSPKSFK